MPAGCTKCQQIPLGGALTRALPVSRKALQKHLCSSSLVMPTWTFKRSLMGRETIGAQVDAL